MYYVILCLAPEGYVCLYIFARIAKLVYFERTRIVWQSHNNNLYECNENLERTKLKLINSYSAYSVYNTIISHSVHVHRAMQCRFQIKHIY